MLAQMKHHVPDFLTIVFISIAQFGIVYWYLKVALQYQPKSTKRILAWVLLMTAIAIFPLIQLAIYGHAIKFGYPHKFTRSDRDQAHLWLGAQAAITITLIFSFLIRKEIFGKK